MAETFAQAFQHRRRFRGSSDEEAGGWLYAIARHQLSHYVRHGVTRRKAVRKLGIRVQVVSEDDYDRIFELVTRAIPRMLREPSDGIVHPAASAGDCGGGTSKASHGGLLPSYTCREDILAASAGAGRGSGVGALPVRRRVCDQCAVRDVAFKE